MTCFLSNLAQKSFRISKTDLYIHVVEGKTNKQKAFIQKLKTKQTTNHNLKRQSTGEEAEYFSSVRCLRSTKKK